MQQFLYDYYDMKVYKMIYNRFIYNQQEYEVLKASNEDLNRYEFYYSILIKHGYKPDLIVLNKDKQLISKGYIVILRNQYHQLEAEHLAMDIISRLYVKDLYRYSVKLLYDVEKKLLELKEDEIQLYTDVQYILGMGETSLNYLKCIYHYSIPLSLITDKLHFNHSKLIARVLNLKYMNLYSNEEYVYYIYKQLFLENLYLEFLNEGTVTHLKDHLKISSKNLLNLQNFFSFPFPSWLTNI